MNKIMEKVKNGKLPEITKAKGKKKNRKLSIRWKILIPSTITVCVLATVLSVSAYNTMHKGMTTIGKEQAYTVAKFSVNAIDPKALSSLAVGCDNTPEYKAIQETLAKLQQEYHIAYLYTLYTDGNQVYYGVDADTSENHSHPEEHPCPAEDKLLSASAYGGQNRDS